MTAPPLRAAFALWSYRHIAKALPKDQVSDIDARALSLLTALPIDKPEAPTALLTTAVTLLATCDGLQSVNAEALASNDPIHKTKVELYHQLRQFAEWLETQQSKSGEFVARSPNRDVAFNHTLATDAATGFTIAALDTCGPILASVDKVAP
jgi:hypothetical protein